MFSVYILFSSSISKFYCGQTKDLEDRIHRHNSGHEKSTKAGAPWTLIHFEVVSTRSEAVKLETRIKKRGIKRWLIDKGIY